MPFLIAFVILLVSHLLEDKDFPQEVKSVAGVVFVVLAILYVLFGLVF
jgi:hypothetical protein